MRYLIKTIFFTLFLAVSCIRQEDGGLHENIFEYSDSLITVLNQEEFTLNNIDSLDTGSYQKYKVIKVNESYLDPISGCSIALKEVVSESTVNITITHQDTSFLSHNERKKLSIDSPVDKNYTKNILSHSAGTVQCFNNEDEKYCVSISKLSSNPPYIIACFTRVK